MNASKTKAKTYIAQLPRSCKARFNVLFQNEIKQKIVTIMDEGSFFIVMTKDMDLYYEIKRLIPEAIGV